MSVVIVCCRAISQGGVRRVHTQKHGLDAWSFEIEHQGAANSPNCFLGSSTLCALRNPRLETRLRQRTSVVSVQAARARAPLRQREGE